jgi:hypothetical protein
MSDQKTCAYRWGSKKRTALYGDWHLGDPLPISTSAVPQACYVNRGDTCIVAFEPEESSKMMRFQLRAGIAALCLVSGILAGISTVRTGCAVLQEPAGQRSRGRPRYEPLLYHQGNELAFASANRDQVERAAIQSAANRDQMERAAVQIQSAWRGTEVRKRTHKQRSSPSPFFWCGSTTGCRTPRITWPGPCPKPCSAAKFQERSGEVELQEKRANLVSEHRAAVCIQANYRGSAARKQLTQKKKNS